MTDRATGAGRQGGRRTFGPLVLLGLVTAGLTAIAGSKPWATAAGRTAEQLAAVADTLEPGRMPAANALGLVCLACWGVLLVSRGRVRRAIAVLAVLAALGAVVSVPLGYRSTAAGVRTSYAGLGQPDVAVSHTPWLYVTGVAAVLAVVVAAAAVRLVGSWPEMGSRYDAPVAGTTTREPGAGPASDAEDPESPEDAEVSSLDLWRAMDDGRDPTL